MLLNVAKSAAMFFTIGVALAYGVPLIMGAFAGNAAASISAVTGASALSQGLLFAGFGGLNEALSPVFNKIFRIKPAEIESTKETIIAKAHEKLTSVSNDISKIIEPDEHKTSFAQKINYEK